MEINRDRGRGGCGDSELGDFFSLEVRFVLCHLIVRKVGSTTSVIDMQ